MIWKNICNRIQVIITSEILQTFLSSLFSKQHQHYSRRWNALCWFFSNVDKYRCKTVKKVYSQTSLFSGFAKILFYSALWNIGECFHTHKLCILPGKPVPSSRNIELAPTIVCILTRRFYLTGCMTNLYSLIWGSLERLFSELFLSDACWGINTNLLPLIFFVQYFNNLSQNINHYSNI